MCLLPCRAGHPGPDRRDRRHEGHVRATDRPAHLRLRQRTIWVTTTLEEPVSPAFEPDDVPRSLATTRDAPDIAFRSIATAIGAVVLLVTGAIGLFLGYQMIPTL